MYVVLRRVTPFFSVVCHFTCDAIPSTCQLCRAGYTSQKAPSGLVSTPQDEQKMTWQRRLQNRTSFFTRRIRTCKPVNAKPASSPLADSSVVNPHRVRNSNVRPRMYSRTKTRVFPAKNKEFSCTGPSKTKQPLRSYWDHFPSTLHALNMWITH